MTDTNYLYEYFLANSPDSSEEPVDLQKESVEDEVVNQ